jgi:hypothetical protein
MDLLRRLQRRVVNDVCYWICEYLDGKTQRRTTCTKLAAGEAIAVADALDLERALNEPALPTQISAALGAFSPSDWREIMSTADSSEAFMESELKKPQWAHLRSTRR